MRACDHKGFQKPFIRFAPATALFLCSLAQARVGGGQSFSGGSHGGGGGGDSSIAIDLIFELLRLFFYLNVHFPWIGIPFDIFIICVVYVYFKNEESELALRSASRGSAAYTEGLVKGIGTSKARNTLHRLRLETDPNFSTILFEDYCYALFAQVHTLRGKRKLSDLSDRVSDDAIQSLKALAPHPLEVKDIIVGSSRLASAVETTMNGEDVTRVVFEFQANYTETTVEGGAQSYYSDEYWTFVRKKGVLSRPPEKIRQITCPACGAPPEKNPDGTCPSCGRLIRSGQFDWYVTSVQTDRTRRSPVLTSTTEETGTTIPTLIDPELSKWQAELPKLQEGFSWQRFEERTLFIFNELQKAWTTRSWEKARPYETDGLFQTHAYWINEYRKQGLTNVLDQIQVQKVELARVDADKYYVSVTVRIFAQMLDYTRDDKRVICGNPNRLRPFTEYWTLIRSRLAPSSKPGDRNCPSCGASLKVNMAGNCEFCHAKITSGEFDWVLSKIEQDESYA
jgi:hypothetical protein